MLNNFKTITLRHYIDKTKFDQSYVIIRCNTGVIFLDQAKTRSMPGNKLFKVVKLQILFISVLVHKTGINKEAAITSTQADLRS